MVKQEVSNLEVKQEISANLSPSLTLGVKTTLLFDGLISIPKNFTKSFKISQSVWILGALTKKITSSANAMWDSTFTPPSVYRSYLPSSTAHLVRVDGYSNTVAK